MRESTGERHNYSTAQIRAEQKGLSLKGAPVPMGRGW